MSSTDIVTRTRVLVVVAALFSVLVLVALVQVTADRRACVKQCKAEGFSDVRFTPKRRSEPPQCHCLTEAEAKDTSRVHEGKPVQLPDR